jgi:hypothetical protein
VSRGVLLRALCAAADASPTGGERFCPLLRAEHAIARLCADACDPYPPPGLVRGHPWGIAKRREWLLEVRAVPNEWQRLLFILSTVCPTSVGREGYAYISALIADLPAE